MKNQGVNYTEIIVKRELLTSVSMDVQVAAGFIQIFPETPGCHPAHPATVSAIFPPVP